MIGKAARDAFFRNVARENPDILVLNYAPGPLKTNMVEILKTKSFLKDWFNDSNNILLPETSVNKLIDILEASKFTSGQHVDFFDSL